MGDSLYNTRHDEDNSMIGLVVETIMEVGRLGPWKTMFLYLVTFHDCWREGTSTSGTILHVSVSLQHGTSIKIGVKFLFCCVFWTPFPAWYGGAFAVELGV